MSELHLLRPWWLLALLPTLLLYWRLIYSQKHQAGWHQWLPGHLSKVLVKSGSKPSVWPIHRFLLIAVLSTLALSGPTWEKLPQPVYQLESGQVVVMDMSPSVLASDISPNRLTRMRFKAIDLVRSGLDGDTGLIAYADDAYIISPLTADNRNLINLIPSLSPQIMPAAGSEPLRALQLADKLLKNAGYPQGDIFWLTDGVDSRELNSLSDYLRSIEHRVSILAVGTENGAPVRDSSGRLLKEDNQVVIAKTYPSRLKDLADITGGAFTSVTANNQDIKELVSQEPLTREGKDSESEQQGDAWRDMGPYVALLILPLILLSWRRGSMLSPLIITLLLPTSLYSPELRAAQEDPIWPQAFLNEEQQAQQLYKSKDYQEAAKLSKKPLRKGAALYRQKNYEAAANAFSQSQTAEAQYNLGNALAQQQQFDAAIEAYNQALEQRPDWTKAKENKQLVEQLKDQKSKGSGKSEKQSDKSDSKNDKSSKESEKSGEQTEQQNSESNANKGSQQSNEGQPKNRQPEKSKKEKQEQKRKTPAEKQRQKTPENQDDTKQAPNKLLQQKVSEGEIDPEKAQQLKQWMNRVPDDPSILLRNKMLLESQRRRQRRSSEPQGEDKKW